MYMAKLKLLSDSQLKKELEKRRIKAFKEYKWLHEDRRWKALLNEYERRVMKK